MNFSEGQIEIDNRHVDNTELHSAVLRLKELAEGIADKSLNKEIDELTEKISVNKFYMVVVGQFKRGKSTLINALLDKIIAPVAVTPLTSLITIFEYGELPQAKVFFINGSILEIDIEQIDQYISEAENPDNVKEVEHIKIFTDSELLKSFTLIDTPGIGSVSEHNSATTYQFVPKIDAALFVLSADIPITKTEVEFLQSLNKSVPKIIFSMNKTDLLSEQELLQITDYNRVTIATALGQAKEDVFIIPVSGKLFFAVQTSLHNIDNLRDHISDVINREKHSILFRTVTNRLDGLITYLETLLNLRLEALQTPIESLKQKQKSLRDSMELMKGSKGDFDILISGKITQLQNRIIEKMNKVGDELKAKIKIDLTKDLSDLSQQDAMEVFQEEKIKRIVNELESIKLTIESETKVQFRELLLQYSAQSQSFIQELSVHLQSLLNVNLDLIIGQFDLDVYSSFYFRTNPDYPLSGIQKNLLYRFFPEKYLRKKLLQKVWANCESIVISNSANIIYDLNYRIQESFRKFSYELNEKLTALLSSIDFNIQKIITEKSRTENNIELAVEEVESKINEVKKVRESIQT